MKVGVVYHSMSGNTEEMATIIAREAERYDHDVKLVSVKDLEKAREAIEWSDFALLGTFTWGDGELPQTMRQALRSFIKEKPIAFPPVAVFGTGDSQFPKFCRSVDEVAYHVGKVTDVLGQCKIEQAPRGHAKEVVCDYTKAMITEWKEHYDGAKQITTC